MARDECDDGQFVGSKPRVYPPHSTIQHWQLRDLIHCTDKPDEFIYVHGHNVIAYDTMRQEARPLLEDLSFKPNSITAGYGFVAAGGQRSQLAVKNLATQSCFNTSVGGSINNAMTISRHLDDTRLLISNNDETIKVYSLPTLTHVTDIKLPVAVNYCSVSPDGKRLVAVGDSRQAWLFDVKPGGYVRTHTFAACVNAAFSCAWNCTSDKFAVACQDGSVSVWDIRSVYKPLATLYSEQLSNNKGACRSVKFSPSSALDLMVFTEHESLAHVVCTRTFNQRQTLRIAPEYEYSQGIAGACFSQDSRKLYIALECGVYQYDVDTTQRRRFAAGSLV